MKDPVVNEALRQIQDIVRQETGNPLAGTAKSRVERVLASALGQLAGVRGEDTNLTRDVTILLADLRGFTTISANYPAVVVLELLCSPCACEHLPHQHDQFGAVLVIFGAGRTTTTNR
jgi:adenylate cyclase